MVEQDSITPRHFARQAFTIVRATRSCAWFAFAILTASFTVDGACAAAVGGTAPSQPAALTGEFQVYSPGTNEVTILLEKVAQRTMQIKDSSASTRQWLQLARKGDKISVEVDDAVEPEIVTKVDAIQRPVSAHTRLIGLAASAFVVLLAASLATRWRPQRFMIGVDNRYSNSQTQLALWFAVMAIVYLAVVILRAAIFKPSFVGGVGITANLAVLTGLSALSFGGAKAITVSKLDAMAQPGAPAPAKVPAAQPNLMTDLFTNDNKRADLGDFQMIAVTLTAVVIFAVSAYQWLGLLAISDSVTLPDVDTSLLTGFGVGQGAYLVKKAAVKVGDG